MSPPEVFAVRGLSVTFRRIGRAGPIERISVLRDVSLNVHEGEVIAVLGSSGAGKSVLAHAMLGILPGNAEVAGSIVYRGEVLTAQRLEQIRGHDVALIPQSIGFLDPLVTAKRAVRWAARRAGMSGADARVAQQRAFADAGLPEEAGERFPFELSGGMVRRVLLSIAMVGNASVLIADEPTPGLHPEAVRESLHRLRGLADKGKAVVLISHDIVASLAVAHRVAVFLDGQIVEVAPADAFEGRGARLQHPYARALWNALPQNAFEVPHDGATCDAPHGSSVELRTRNGFAQIAVTEVDHSPSL